MLSIKQVIKKNKESRTLITFLVERNKLRIRPVYPPVSPSLWLYIKVLLTLDLLYDVCDHLSPRFSVWQLS